MYLPNLFPDEILYSWVARVYHYHGMPIRRGFDLALFGNDNVNMDYSLPGYLGNLASLFPVEWNISAQRLACQNTLFPYWTAYLSSEQRHAILDAMTFRRGRCTTLISEQAVFSARLTHLRFCSECNFEMKEEFGEIYWRRLFQVSSSVVCPTHMKVLSQSTVDVGSQRRDYAYLPANEKTCRIDARPLVPSIYEIDIYPLVDIVNTNQDLLELTIWEMDRINLRVSNDNRIKELGLLWSVLL